MFDIGQFVQDVGDKVAGIKGYGSLDDLLAGSAAKNIARITDKANETKQSPPIVEPTPYVKELLAEQGGAFGMSRAQLLIAGALGITVLFLALRR